jgi:hypothetical protein
MSSNLCRNGQTTALIAGHSHTHCFGLRGESEQQPRLVELTTGPVNIFGLQMSWPPPSNLLEIVRESSQGKHLLLLWRGNEHIAKFLFRAEPSFDFLSSVFPDAPLLTDAKLLPESLVETAYSQYEAELIIAIEFLRECKTQRLSLLSPPPPKGNDDLLRPLLGIEPEFVRRANELGWGLANIPLTPAAMRLKLWALLQKKMKTIAARYGISCIEPPLEARDDAGFLKEGYWAHDATHADHAYGALYLWHIAKFLRDNSTEAIAGKTTPRNI